MEPEKPIIAAIPASTFSWLTGGLACMMVITLTSCSSSSSDQEWRQRRQSSQDTFYPGVKFGMSRDQVKAAIPRQYSLVEDTKSTVRVERTKPDGIVETITFRFEDGRLTTTDDYAARP